jgi:hypothetical protein
LNKDVISEVTSLSYSILFYYLYSKNARIIRKLFDNICKTGENRPQ